MFDYSELFFQKKFFFFNQNNAIRVHHVWVLCRDMEEFNPATAWKLLELHIQKGNLVL